MKIISQEFQNVGLLNGEFTVKGNVIVVSGANRTGKSTFCKMFEMICNNSVPDDIIAKGFDKASCKITLDDGVVIDWSKATDKKPVVKIIYANGQKVNATKDLLKAFAPARVDVNEFARLQPKQKKEAVASLSGIDLDTLNQVIKTAEENRTFINRQLKTEQAKVEGLDISLAGSDLVDVAELQSEVSALTEKRNTQEKQLQALESLVVSQDSIADEINRLNERLKELKKRNGQIIQDIQRGQKAVESHVDYSEDINGLNQRINSASETNTAILQARQQAKTFEAVEDLRKESETAEQAVKDARQGRIDAVKSATLPAGLTIDDSGEQLFFTDANNNSINIESANDAQKIIIGLQLAFHNIGQIKALSVDLSLLDKKNRQYVFEWCESNDLQLFAERVNDDDDIVVEVK